ncbi:hypothetical protein HZ326_25251 [Fusarium oxysporum f. sp. albedinis]|nr:hypothetical protein HZ326_25251 [Fusarium oxysporum f. sp. albedinis]
MLAANTASSHPYLMGDNFEVLKVQAGAVWHLAYCSSQNLYLLSSSDSESVSLKITGSASSSSSGSKTRRPCRHLGTGLDWTKTASQLSSLNKYQTRQLGPMDISDIPSSQETIKDPTLPGSSAKGAIIILTPENTKA